jgi:uncharacterized protein DUF2764
MTLWSNSYHMLVCSLPPLPVRLETARLPISLERLRDRLRMLEAEDAREIEQMFEVLRWSRQFEEAEDAAVVARFAELMRDIRNALIREVLMVLMDIRMITTALRRRRRGLGPPPCGFGHWFEHIRRHFTEPDFGLGHVYPQLAQLAPLLDQGDVLQLNRKLAEATWAYFRQRADDYTFSFEAVVLYVARWSLLAQWQQLQAERGRPIFEALVTEALGTYANVYA